MKTWNNADKSAWGDGPWQTEADKAQWIAHGLDCLIVRSHTGALCGYVGLPPSHPFYQKDYTDSDIDVEVHGGLTFAGPCANTDDESRFICHAEQGAANKTVWWLGFDCGHHRDHVPAYDAMLPERLRDTDSVYRNFEYVKEQTERLAEQLTKVA